MAALPIEYSLVCGGSERTITPTMRRLGLAINPYAVLCLPIVAILRNLRPNDGAAKSLPRITIVVLPRAQFSKAQLSLECVFAETKRAFSLIYVDGNSPAPVRRYIERRAVAKGFRLIREERYLPANVARNLALPYSDTQFVVCIDNDVVLHPHWLEPLPDCANETGAWAVGPL